MKMNTKVGIGMWLLTIVGVILIGYFDIGNIEQQAINEGPSLRGLVDDKLVYRSIHWEKDPDKNTRWYVLSVGMTKDFEEAKVVMNTKENDTNCVSLGICFKSRWVFVQAENHAGISPPVSLFWDGGT